MSSDRRKMKLCPKRPGSSSRRSEFENSCYDYSENKSKISRLPRRTSSFEGKVSTANHGKLGTKKRASAMSMIPRPGMKLREPTIKKTTSKTTVEAPKECEISAPVPIPPKTELSHMSLENKVSDDLNNFKNEVLKIPEYWSDAGETIWNILKNAVQIITKQYPTSDIHLFEQDIQRVLKDTETVKQQILLRIENIINKADNLYNEKLDELTGTDEQELKVITKRMESLKNEVNIRKNVFGDLLKYGSEMKGLLEIENLLKLKAVEKDENGMRPNKLNGLKKDSRWTEREKCKQEGVGGNNKKAVKVRSAGDSEERGVKNQSGTEGKTAEEKTTQTLISWIKELNTREKELQELTESVREIYQLCRENILKFKNINFQIKMKEYSNKSRGEVIYRDSQVLKEGEENNEKTISIHSCGDEPEVILNDKTSEVKGKNKVLRQQRKLIQIRNELLGMLKDKCNLEERM